jgi:acyl-coenzyme A synthetase/AMP-(fatty) acid ligase/acyl carrier protein
LPGKCMVFGGEAFSVKIIDYLRKAGFPGRVYNHYGPTEATIGKLIYRVDVNETYTIIPMGRPFSNAKVYVVDNKGELCPPGVSGELWIGGRGIARGYLGRPDLTAESFIKNPFDLRDEYSLYRTGDIVQWNAAGYLEFNGRRDDQVKINGQRIETGEVENILALCPVIKQCFVCTMQKGEQRFLTAYIVPVNDFNRDEVVSYLKTRLPDYMIPTAWVQLQSLPLNQIGKIDRTALPEPGTQEEVFNYEAPRDTTDEILVEIWEQLLKVKPIGIQDNFFERGGHSLLIIRVISHIRLKMGVTIPVTAFFKFPTVAKMSDYIQAVSVSENAWTESETSTIEI